MYKIKKWSRDMNLTFFYEQCEKLGFHNNSSEEQLVGALSYEREKQVWILFYNDIPVGSFAAHTAEELGKNWYRIVSRACVLTHLTDTKNKHRLATRNDILQHQHIVSQFFIPVCIDWCPKNINIFISSIDEEMASQRKVHKIFCPLLEKKKLLINMGEMMYKNKKQTIWCIRPHAFLMDLEKYPRWNCLYEV